MIEQVQFCLPHAADTTLLSFAQWRDQPVE